MIAFIADLHIGVKLPHRDFLHSLNSFFEHIKNHDEECTDIFVVGDFFDHRLNIDESKFAVMMLINLIDNRCRKDGSNIDIHFVHGTYNHDYEQYEIYMPFFQKFKNVNVDYIDEACVKTISDGRTVLYLPQEYGNKDYSEFINENKHYDIIVGHGPLSSSTLNPCKSAGNEIVHSVETLGSISDICVFGHYHGYTDFGNHVFYAGPWLRWQYGQDEERVFMFVDNDLKVTTIKNEHALEYKTIQIESPEQLRQELSNEITTPHRYIIKPETKQDSDTYLSIMTINRNENIKYIIDNPVEQQGTPDEIIADETVSHVVTNVEPIESLIDYISDKYKQDVEKEIRDYESKILKE